MAKRGRPRLHPAERYARDIVRGKIRANKWVKFACKRHLDDRKHAGERGFYFDEAKAQRVLDFFGLLRHSKGEWAGLRVKLEPWQQFALWSVFGWYRDDSERWVVHLKSGVVQDTRFTRRFRTFYLEVARKNGKSFLGSGIGLYMLSADREPGAEVVTYATKKDQARIIHKESVRMVQASAPLSKKLTLYRDNIHVLKTASKYEPLSSDAKTLDGLHLHCGICDELHAYPNREGWDKLKTAQSARRQPLMVAVTTAGNDRLSFGYDMHDYARKVAAGIVEDDTFFGLVYGLDAKDWRGEGWKDERNWIKANPNLGVSKYVDAMRENAKLAEEMPSFKNTFLQLDLNVWVTSFVNWMPEKSWDKCKGEIPYYDLPAHLEGRRCYGGLDLASTSDVAALVLEFPPVDNDPFYYLLSFFWVPEETVIVRSRKEGVKYDLWVDEGVMEATPGDVIDYDYILGVLADLSQRFSIVLLGYDRHEATYMILQAQDDLGIPVAQVSQGYAGMNAPMKDVERLVKKGEYRHGGNPVLSWMMSNVVAKRDAGGRMMADKKKSKEKIDGVSALLMARAVAMGGEGKKKSRYEEDGIRVV